MSRWELGSLASTWVVNCKLLGIMGYIGVIASKYPNMNDFVEKLFSFPKNEFQVPPVRV